MRYKVYRRVALPALLALVCILAAGWGKPVSSQTGQAKFALQAHSSPPLLLAAATEKGALLTSTATATGCSPSWEIVASPNTGSGGNRLASVAVVSSDDIWAVGYYVQSQAVHALAMHWNGIAWSIVPSPVPGAHAGELTGVTAISSDDVWAVGSYNTQGSYRRTLAMHWDGKQWNVITTPNLGDTTLLYAVSAVAPNDVWAIGSYGYPPWGVGGPISMHWDGQQWNLATMPRNPQCGGCSHLVTGVTALSSNDIWVVGSYEPYGWRTLIEHWDGTAWTIIPSPNVGTYDSYLTGVTANSPSDIWAVGYYMTSANRYSTLTLHWNGSAWSIVPSPNIGSNYTKLWEVDAVSSDDIWAVGSYANMSGPEATLTMHWNGTEWSIAPSPSPGLNINELYGVAVISAVDVWAVGSAGTLDDSTRRTLIERYGGNCVTPTATSAATMTPSATITPAQTTMATASASVTATQPQTPTAEPTRTFTATLPVATTTATVIATATATTMGATSTATVTMSVTAPTGTSTIPPTVPTTTAIPTSVSCSLQYSDVYWNDTFYTYIRCLACRGIVSGYADGTFRPNNDVTRGQLAKIVSNAAGFTESPDPQIFEDVPSSNTFYQWINRLARRGHMSGYPCGGPGEPCLSGMPYFRPSANATRGQTSKIVSNAAGFVEEPTEQTFEDVPLTHTFYREIQRLASRGIMGGYPCGGAGEPCVTGKPYFRPQNNVTRGQSAKIVANTFFPGCQTP